MTTKTVYLYDPITGVLVAPYNAPLSLDATPSNPIYLEPVYSTELVPLGAGANQVDVFSSGAWTLEHNYVGETWYDQTTGAPTVIESIGTPASNLGATLPPAIILANANSAQISILQAAYIAAINAPVPFTNTAGVASTYPSGNTVSLNGNTATQNLANVITAGSAAWTLGHWLDVNNTAQTFTFADLQGLAAAMESVETLDWTDLVAKVAEVQMAATVAAKQAITF